MAQIKAADVAKLRKMTGAGMMDCKKALQEAEGDFDKAIEILRKKGQKVANKRADREAKEGAVLAKVSDDNKNAAIIVLNCETDFVAKNEDFVKFAYQILDLAIDNLPENLDALKALKMGDVTVADEIVNKTGVIGEKLELSYYAKISGGTTVAYIHPGNKVSSIVAFNKEGVDNQVAKDVAMQVAAMNPVAVDKDDVPEEIINKEIEIGKEQAINEGKPADLAEKIARGKLNKYFTENTLLNQAFIKDSKKSVRQYLQEFDKELTVVDFKRYSLNV